MDRNAGAQEIVLSIYLSLSARRAWIEIKALHGFFLCALVALRKESVDRNVRPPAGPHVAHKVALRKESVDRNVRWSNGYRHYSLSLSARRAWIEMLNPCEICQGLSGSLSARRAWIEILITLPEMLNFTSRSPQGERG